MGDRFYKDIEIPDLGPEVNPPAPDEGFVQVYGRNGKLAYKNAQGVEVILEPQIKTRLDVNGGNASTTDEEFKLRIDFGSVGGASINPDNLP